MELNNIQPQEVWKNFSLLNAVPRPSKKEEKVIEFIKNFGLNLGLSTTVDHVGNVIIKKPATPGMEDRKPIVLQSHLDMVCQKNNDVNFDFDTMGIQMEVDGDWVKAKGTTLGADNGLGVAAIMAVLESATIAHPKLEALFTIDEETGMTGAMGLKPGTLEGEILLNLDTEEDDEIDIGCAGGIDVSANKSYDLSPATGMIIKLDIKGLKGGHSGMDIHKGYGNANKILSRFLLLAVNDQQLELVSIDGGGLRNAIPREAHAVFAVRNAVEYIEQAHTLKADILQEFEAIEPELSISIENFTTHLQAINQQDSASLANALSAIHNGVFRMSPDVEDLVEASNNVARVELKEGDLKIHCLARSSVESSKTLVSQQLVSVFHLAGIESKLSGSYPGWKPRPGSEIVKIMEEIYEKKFDSKPRVVACHAGLECGIIGANYPQMEMVSFGPTIKGAHSPEEKASISSTQKFWAFLQEILKSIPKK